jgi:hypothetical protein
VLARNSSTMARPLALDERLTYSTEVDPDYVRNDKGDYEIAINTTARDAQGGRGRAVEALAHARTPDARTADHPRPHACHVCAQARRCGSTR